MKPKRRKLLIQEILADSEHPGQELYGLLLKRIQNRQASEGLLQLESAFLDAMERLYRIGDSVEALTAYGPLSEELDRTLSRSRAKAQVRLAEFLASRPGQSST